MRIAYADPPYIGQAKRMYGPDAREVNHPLLLAHLAEFDGWALSATSNSLRYLLPLCPEGARVAAWVKKTAVYKKGVNPTYAWEPVIYYGGRRGNQRHNPNDFVLDWVHCLVAQFHDNPGRIVPGAKPQPFCFWLFDLLGMEQTDTLVDLFPGSGAVSHAWDAWCNQHRLDFSASEDVDPTEAATAAPPSDAGLTEPPPACSWRRGGGRSRPALGCALGEGHGGPHAEYVLFQLPEFGESA